MKILVACAAAAALVGGCQRGGMSNGDLAALEQSVRDHLANLQWSDMRFGGRCGDSFTIGAVELRDIRAQGQLGAVDAIVTISEAARPRYSDFPWAWCFGSRGSGSTRRIQFEFAIERWESGWRLSRQQRRLSPF